MAQMLTVEQAAQKMQMSPRLLRVFLRTGKLRGHKVGRTWRVQEADIARYTVDYREPVAAERISAYGICTDVEDWSTDEFMKAKQTEARHLGRFANRPTRSAEADAGFPLRRPERSDAGR